MSILANTQELLEIHGENNVSVVCERRIRLREGNRTVKRDKLAVEKNELLRKTLAGNR